MSDGAFDAQQFIKFLVEFELFGKVHLIEEIYLDWQLRNSFKSCLLCLRRFRNGTGEKKRCKLLLDQQKEEQKEFTC